MLDLNDQIILIILYSIIMLIRYLIFIKNKLKYYIFKEPKSCLTKFLVISPSIPF